MDKFGPLSLDISNVMLTALLNALFEALFTALFNVLFRVTLGNFRVSVRLAILYLNCINNINANYVHRVVIDPVLISQLPFVDNTTPGHIPDNDVDLIYRETNLILCRKAGGNMFGPGRGRALSLVHIPETEPGTGDAVDWQRVLRWSIGLYNLRTRPPQSLGGQRRARPQPFSCRLSH
jgi:hypothetical protein